MVALPRREPLSQPYRVARRSLPLAESRRAGQPSPGPPLSEAELARIWEMQSYPRGALATADGQVVRVVHPGRRGGAAGPDFRDAVVLIGGVRRLGDVELHLRASGFAQHGHAADPAYANLVLHVVFEDDGGGRTSLGAGKTAPVAAFAPWLRRRTQEIVAWLGRPPRFEPPCRDGAARLGRPAVRAVLAAAGRQRLRERAAVLAEARRAAGAEAAVWAALLETLGYGGDRAGFQRLAAAAPLASLGGDGSSAAEVTAALVYLGGLGQAPRCSALPPPISPKLHATGGRPANRPERRLAAAARLLVRAEGKPAAYAIETVATAADAKALIAAWSVGPDLVGGPALLGRARAQELLLNAVLPFASLTPGLAEKAFGLAATLPALPAYGRTAAFERDLSPDRRRPVRSGLEQQGLLAFQKQWCSQGGCGRCPLS